jgi:hypothetical protein
VITPSSKQWPSTTSGNDQYFRTGLDKEYQLWLFQANKNGPNLHASKDTNEEQDHENSNVEDEAEVYRPCVPFDRTFLNQAVVQEDQGQSCKVGCTNEGELCTESQDACTFDLVERNVPNVSIPAVGIVRHDHDDCQADGEEVGDNNKDVIQTWPGLP